MCPVSARPDGPHQARQTKYNIHCPMRSIARMPHSVVGRTLGHQLPVTCSRSIGALVSAATLGRHLCKTKQKGSDSAWYVKKFWAGICICPHDHALFLGRRMAPLPALVRLAPRGCSALCYMGLKKVSLALPQDLHLLMYLLSPFPETVCGQLRRIATVFAEKAPFRFFFCLSPHRKKS